MLVRVAMLMAVSSLVYTLLAFNGVEHWTLFVLLHFVITFGHGFIFPCAQVGAVEPFPNLAGAAAGLFGAISVIFALIVGLAIGASQTTSTFPLSLIASIVVLLLLASFQTLPGAKHSA